MTSQDTSYTSVGDLVKDLGWTEIRAHSILVSIVCVCVCVCVVCGVCVCMVCVCVCDLIPFSPKDHLVREGMAWVDDQSGGETLYWFPGLFTTTTGN